MAKKVLTDDNLDALSDAIADAIDHDNPDELHTVLVNLDLDDDAIGEIASLCSDIHECIKSYALGTGETIAEKEDRVNDILTRAFGSSWSDRPVSI